MILKQVIRYTNADAIEATWVDENGVAIKSSGSLSFVEALQ